MRGGIWRTASRNSSWRCSRIAPRRRRCGPTSCACTSPPSPTRCWSCCGAGAWPAPSWRGRNATRSASSCSRSACGSGSAYEPYACRSMRASPTRAFSGRCWPASRACLCAVSRACSRDLVAPLAGVAGITVSLDRLARQNERNQPRIWRS